MTRDQAIAKVIDAIILGGRLLLIEYPPDQFLIVPVIGPTELHQMPDIIDLPGLAPFRMGKLPAHHLSPEEAIALIKECYP